MADKKINVLVVPAGSRMAVGIIKSLKKEEGVRIVSADAEKLAAGLYLSDKSYLISLFSDKNNFFKDLEKIIKKEKIDIVIPALDPLLDLFAIHKTFFKSLKVKILLSSKKTISLCRDKWRTYKFLKNIVPFPKSFIDKEDVDVPFPLFIKPRCGSGSVDAFKITSQEELNFYYKKIKDPIIQEYLTGEEYTVDCFSDMKGKLLYCVPRIRLDTKAGVSIKGKIIKNTKIEKIAEKIVQKIKFAGPFFFQLKGEGNMLKLMEVGARFGGGMPLSVAAGFNIYFLSLKLFLGQPIGVVSKIKYGLYFTRFDEEIYLTEKDLNKK